MPFRKTPFTKDQHLLVLRLSIFGVAVFIFLFSLLFQQSQYIALFFAITGAIFAGGSGSVLIGGLYWKRGTTAAAWSAMIVGSGIAVSGIMIHQVIDDFFFNGQMFWGVAMAASTATYILVSLLGKRTVFDLDTLLKRDRDGPESVSTTTVEEPSRGLKMLGMGREFTKGDKAVYFLTYTMIVGWTLVFVAGTVYNLTHDVSDTAWANFWQVYVYIQLAISIAVVVWFTVGGVRDLKDMLRRLDVMDRDDFDDGVVRNS